MASRFVFLPSFLFIAIFLHLGNHRLTNAKRVEVDTNERVDCWPSRYPEEPVKRKEECTRAGCVWDDQFDKYNPTVPRCYFPADQGYQVDSVQAAGDPKIQLKWPVNYGLQNPYSQPNLEVGVETKRMGAALAIKIGREDRFTPPVPLSREAIIESPEKLIFKHSPKGRTFSFTVERQTDGQKIWDTSIGGFVFGDKFIQIATYLPTDRIYGFGENLHHQLKHDFSVYKTWGMYSRDQPVDSYTPGSRNEYGVQPFYVGLESSGKAHGVLIFNSNAQEYATGPAPHLIYRTIGGQLELFFFPGPTPEDVIRQYQQLIGRPYLPAYWSFGFQLCRFGYKSLENLKATVKRTRDAQIPFDVQYADIDYMDRYKDFTYDEEKFAGFPEYVEKELHANGMRLILILDPPVQVNYSSFQNGQKMGASFIEWPTTELVQKEINDLYDETKGTKVMLGAMWPDYHSAFPDWLDPEGKTTKWWVDEFVRFRKMLPFDGIWIDMNEPSVFGTNEEVPWYMKPSFIDDKPPIKSLRCPDSDFDYPPYRTWNVYQYDTETERVSLNQNSLCMIGRTGRGRWSMYDTHSLYGWSEMVATNEALRAATGGKRGAIISRSTFPSSGHYGGHWLGDNQATWYDLRLSIIGIQEFNMFGIPYVGADVCGFQQDTNEELCLRWQQLGAFYSFYRNHNDINRIEQDPAQWPSVAKATREANLFRYRHLPYLYSLHFHVTIHGGTVVRPMFFEFPLDPNTHTNSFQFMWGPAILVLPVVSANVDKVHGYLPQNAVWYSMSEAHEYGQQMPNGYSTFNAPRDTALPVFLRGGHIIPRQVPAMTTDATRKNPLQLLIGLVKNSVSTGELYWDDGETAFNDIAAHPYQHCQFKAESNDKRTTVEIVCTQNGGTKVAIPRLHQIELFSHAAHPKFETVEVNGAKIAMDSNGIIYDPAKRVARIEAHTLVNLADEKQKANENKWTISWRNEPAGDGGDGSNGGVAVHAASLCLMAMAMTIAMLAKFI